MHHVAASAENFIDTLRKYKSELEGFARNSQLFPPRFIVHYYAFAKDATREAVIREADQAAAAAVIAVQQRSDAAHAQILAQPGFRDLIPHFQQGQVAPAARRTSTMGARIRLSSSSAPMTLPEPPSRPISPFPNNVFSPEPGPRSRLPTVSETGPAPLFSPTSIGPRPPSTFSAAGHRLSSSTVDDLAAALDALAAAHTLACEDAARIGTIPMPATLAEIRTNPMRAYTLMEIFTAHYDAALGLGNRSPAGVYAEHVLTDFAKRIDISSGDYHTYGELIRSYGRALLLYAYLDAAYCFINICLASCEKLADFSSEESLAAIPDYSKILELCANAITNFYQEIFKLATQPAECEAYTRSWQRLYREQITGLGAPTFDFSELIRNYEKYWRALDTFKKCVTAEQQFIATKMPR